MGLISWYRKRKAYLIATNTPKAIKETFSFFSPKQQDALGELGSWFAKFLGVPETVSKKMVKAFLDDDEQDQEVDTDVEKTTSE